MTRWRTRSLLVVVCFSSLIAAIPAWAAAEQAAQATAAVALPKGVERVTSVEGITEYRLTSNGLKVLLFPDPTKETITVNVTYLVGSAHENYGETGMAHLLEHLVFKGTPRHPNIPQELTAHGSRPNGTTWTDRTNYFETFAATDENLQWALDLEADRMVNSFIAKKDLDSEMTVVRNEFELGENDPFSVLLERTMSSAYLWHNYGKTTIGARSDIENVPIDRLQAFYKRYYQPDNAVLLVAGRFDEPKTLALIDKHFSPIAKPTRTLERIYTTEPTQDGERSVTLRRVGDTQMVCTVYHVPSGAHQDFAAVDIISQVLGDTPSGRLHKALVESKKASSSFGFNFQWREPTIAIFGAEVRVGHGARSRARRAAANRRGIRCQPAHQGGSRAGTRPAAQEHRSEPESVRPDRAHAERVHRSGGLAALLPASRSPAQDHRRRGSGGRGQVFQAGEPHAGSVHPDPEARSRGNSHDAGRCRAAQGLQG